MSKLRTLNELQLKAHMGSECWCYPPFAEKYPPFNKELYRYKSDYTAEILKTIRREVIKWIKAIEIKSAEVDEQYISDSFYDIFISFEPESCEADGAIAFAKSFFNITEEDLK